MEKNMETLLWSQLYVMLRDFVGTTFMSIHSITPNKGQFNQGADGSRKAVDKMINLLGHDAKRIRKEVTKAYMLTSCGFDKLVDNARKRLMDKELAQLGIKVEDFIKSIEFMIKDDYGYQLGERKNGDSVNGYLVHSKKDGHPMINVYPSKQRSNPRFFLDTTPDTDIDKAILKPYKSPSYGKPSKKQLEHGLTAETIVNINNFRFENIRHVTINKVTYRVVEDDISEFSPAPTV